MYSKHLTPEQIRIIDNDSKNRNRMEATIAQLKGSISHDSLKVIAEYMYEGEYELAAHLIEIETGTQIDLIPESF